MMRIVLAILVIVFMFSFELNAQEYPKIPSFHRKYFEPLTNTEMRSIAYIITTLATKPLVSLIFYKASIDKAGEQIIEVHPLRFWKEAVTHPQLRIYLNSMNGITKRGFIMGFEESFGVMDQEGLMKEEYLRDLAQAANLPEEQIWDLARHHQWRRMIYLFLSGASALSEKFSY